MPCPKSSAINRNNADSNSDDKAFGKNETPYEKQMYSLHHDPKWLQEVNLGRRVGLYKFQCKLGSGNFSQVKLAVHQLTKERVAVKIVDKGILDDKMIRMLNQEISTMESIHHPNLIRLYEVVETYSKLYLVMEYASGGELYNKVTTVGKLEEIVARNIFAQICSGVHHMHERHIIHRDIKAENVFFSSPSRVKLGDFGFSDQLIEGDDQRLNTFCGSPPYAAPELFCDENYIGGPVDIWALGILLYFMVVGRMPFKGQNVTTLKTSITSGVFHIPKHVTKECTNLIENIIQQNPKSRPTISDILSSDWLAGVILPSFSDGNQNYSLAPTIHKVQTSSNSQYSEVEKTARERLLDLGITSQLLESQVSQGSRSHVIGAYRIVIHRVQKQLSSFLEVDGFLTGTEVAGAEKKKEAEKQSKNTETKFQLNNIINKGNSYNDLFSNCWRRKASSDDSCEIDTKEQKDTKESVSMAELGSTDKVHQRRPSQRRLSKSANSGSSGSERKNFRGDLKPSVVRSTTCNIL